MTGFTSNDGSNQPDNNRNFKILTAPVGTSESSIVLPVNTIKFKLNLRLDGAILTVSDVSSGTSDDTLSFKFPMGQGWCEDNLNGRNSLTIYLKSSKMSDTVQVLYWLR